MTTPGDNHSERLPDMRPEMTIQEIDMILHMLTTKVHELTHGRFNSIVQFIDSFAPDYGEPGRLPRLVPRQRVNRRVLARLSRAEPETEEELEAHVDELQSTLYDFFVQLFPRLILMRQRAVAMQNGRPGRFISSTLLGSIDLNEDPELLMPKEVIDYCSDVYRSSAFEVFPLFSHYHLNRMIRHDAASRLDRSMTAAFCAFILILNEPELPLSFPIEIRLTFFNCSRSLGQLLLFQALSLIAVMQDITCSYEAICVYFLTYHCFRVLGLREYAQLYLERAIASILVIRMDQEQFYTTLSQDDQLFCRRLYMMVFIAERDHAIVSGGSPVLQRLVGRPEFASLDPVEASAGQLLDLLASLYECFNREFFDVWTMKDMPPSFLWVEDFHRSLNRAIPLSVPLSIPGQLTMTQLQVMSIVKVWAHNIGWMLALKHGVVTPQATHFESYIRYPILSAQSRIFQSKPSDVRVRHTLGLFVGDKIADVMMAIGEAVSDLNFINAMSDSHLSEARSVILQGFSVLEEFRVQPEGLFHFAWNHYICLRDPRDNGPLMDTLMIQPPVRVTDLLRFSARTEPEERGRYDPLSVLVLPELVGMNNPVVPFIQKVYCPDPERTLSFSFIKHSKIVYSPSPHFAILPSDPSDYMVRTQSRSTYLISRYFEVPSVLEENGEIVDSGLGDDDLSS